MIKEFLRYKKDGITLYNMDCMEYLAFKHLPEVDLVFFDPPYNVGKDYGEYKDNLSVEEYYKWMKRVIGYCRELSNNRLAVLVASKLVRTYWQLMPDAHLIIVVKSSIGPPNVKTNIFIQYLGLFVTCKAVKRIRDVWDGIRLPGDGYYFREERFDHPGLTAMALTSRVIDSFSEQGDLVLDPFSGTGTTAVCCKASGRRCIGVELNEPYVDIAIERLDKTSICPSNKEKQQIDLFESEE